MGEELVSIIIPAYNRQAVIGRCLCSAIAQDYGNIEILVIDDGSEDETCEAVRTLMEKDSRIRLTVCPHRGVSETRNEGIRHARGTYLVFLDSDDQIEKDYISALVRTEEKFRAGFTLFWRFNTRYMPAGWFPYGEPRLIPVESCWSYYEYHVFSTIGGLYRRDVIERFAIRFEPEISRGEDQVFMFDYISSLRKDDVIAVTNDGRYHENRDAGNRLTDVCQEDIAKYLDLLEERLKLKRAEGRIGEKDFRNLSGHYRTMRIMLTMLNTAAGQSIPEVFRTAGGFTRGDLKILVMRMRKHSRMGRVFRVPDPVLLGLLYSAEKLKISIRHNAASR